MIRVSNGSDDPFCYRATCRECGTKLTYEFDDVMQFTGSMNDRVYTFIPCVCCRGNALISEARIMAAGLKMHSAIHLEPTR